MPGGARNLRTHALVVDGVMYVDAPNEVYALDASNRPQIWQYRRPRTQGVIGDAGAASIAASRSMAIGSSW